MTCRDVDHLIIALVSGRAVPSAVAAHIADCAHCSGLVRALRDARTPAGQLQSLDVATLPDIKAVKPIARASVRWIALVGFVALVAAAGMTLLGAAGWHALSLLQASAVFTTLAGAAALLATSLSRQIVPGSRIFVTPWLLAATGPALMAAIFLALFQPHHEPTFVLTGLVCLRIGLECAIAAGLLFWLALRRGTMFNPVSTGATAGALAGLAGLTVLEIFCPNLNQHHVLVWHLGSAITSTLAGLAIGIIVELRCDSRP